jgi:cytochrome c oxidase cbb3-type subunit 3
MKSINRSLLLSISIILLYQLPSYGAAAKTEINQSVQYTIIAIAIFAIFVALLTILNLNMVLLDNIMRHEGIMPEVGHKSSLWATWKQKAVDIVPLEKESEILLHHDYDGIHELDNNLPPWWLYGFYFTIVFSVLYIGYYHYSESSMNSTEEYAYEVKQAKIAVKEYMLKQSNSIDEDNLTALTDAEGIKHGELIFNTNCIACHLQGGGGSPVSVGPNLTDEYWLHGGDVPSIFNTIKYGVPEKGMIAWKAQLSNADMHKVTSYIVSLQGSNPANAKEPQGSKYVSEQTSETDESI